MGKFAFGVAMVHHDFGVALLASIVRDGEGGGDAGGVNGGGRGVDHMIPLTFIISNKKLLVGSSSNSIFI